MTTSAPGNRVLSLGVFRGATIAAMVLVNTAGDHSQAHWLLLHVPLPPGYPAGPHGVAPSVYDAPCGGDAA